MRAAQSTGADQATSLRRQVPAGSRATTEQLAILDASTTGETIAISAGAGTGKTSILRVIAAARPATRMLYVAYNRAVRLEAEATFPPNVTCKTAHALAYRQFGASIAARLGGPRMTARQNAHALGITRAFGLDDHNVFEPASLATMALHTVARFCRSADPDLAARHFVGPAGLDGSQAAALAERVLPLARRAWDDLTGGPKGRLKPSHDVYLKQWQLTRPVLRAWDVILYEAQDADPCIAAVVEAQRHAQLIAVGDAAQAIYGWRGAGDFLSCLDAKHRLRLTQSWRFGQAVAEEANVWLDPIGTDMRLVGRPDRDSRLERLDRPDTILCRTNAGTIDALLEAHAAGRKAHLVGDGTEMLALARAAERLMNGRPPVHPELVAFTDWPAVQEYAKNDPAGSDLTVAVRMIDRYGPTGVIRAIETAVPERGAEVVISTAHKAKGLEWARVKIAADFREPLDRHTGEPLPIPRAEAMLAYVAVTRAKDVLDSEALAWVRPHLAALAGPGAGPRLDEPPGSTDHDRNPPVSAPQVAPSCAATSEPAGGQPATIVPQFPESAPKTTGWRGRTGSRSDTLPVPISGEATLAALGLAIGMTIGVEDEQGAWVVRGVGKDGSLTCVGGPYSQWRSFPPEWCYPLKRTARIGKMVRGRLPTGRRGLRAKWRTTNGLATKRLNPQELDRTDEDVQ